MVAHILWMVAHISPVGFHRLARSLNFQFFIPEITIQHLKSRFNLHELKTENGIESETETESESESDTDTETETETETEIGTESEN